MVVVRPDGRPVFSGKLPGQVVVDPDRDSRLVYNRDRDCDCRYDPFMLAAPGGPEGFGKNEPIGGAESTLSRCGQSRTLEAQDRGSGESRRGVHRGGCIGLSLATMAIHRTMSQTSTFSTSPVGRGPNPLGPSSSPLNSEPKSAYRCATSSRSSAIVGPPTGSTKETVPSLCDYDRTSGVKNARRSRATTVGCSHSMKCPPDGASVQ